MARNYKAAILITGDNTGGVKAVKATRKQIDGLNKSVDKSGKSFKNYSRNANSSSKALSSLKEQAKLAAGAVGIGLLIRQAATAADTMKQLNARLELATNSTAEYEKAQSRLIEISRNTYTAIDTNVTLYARMSIATKELGIDQETLFKATESLQNSFRTYGTTTEEAASATLQLTQAMAKGKLDGDEFRSVMENAPLVMSALSRELGINKKELFKWSSSGRLQVEDLVSALANSADEFAAQSAKIPQTIKEAFTGLNREFTLMIGTADDATGAAGLFTESINLLADNLGTLFKLVAGGVALKLLGPVVANIGTSFAVSAVAAQRFGVGLVAVNAQAALVTKTMVVLRGAMRFVGGPLGLAALGGYALWQGISAEIENRAERLKELAQVSEEAATAMDKFMSAAGGSELETDSLKTIASEIDIITEKLNQQQTQRQTLLNSTDYASGYLTSRNQLREIDETTNGLEKQLRTLESMAQFAPKLKPVYEGIGKIGDAWQFLLDKGNAVTAGIDAQIESVDKWIESQEEQLAALQKENEYYNKSIEQILLLEAEKQKDLASGLKQKKLIDDITAALIKENETLDANAKAQKAASDATALATANLENARTMILSLKKEHRPMQTMFEDFAESLATLNSARLSPDFTDSEFKEGMTLLEEQAKKMAENMIAEIEGVFESIPSIFGSSIEDIEDVDLSGVFDGFASGLNPAIGALQSFKNELALINELYKSEEDSGKKAFYSTGLAAEFALNSMASMAQEGSDAQKTLAAAAAITNTVLGITAILEQGKGDPYTAFARMAAMAAMVVSMGVQVAGTFGGSGGGGAAQQQARQGTGSVLGDASAKSESINNALDIIAEASEKIVGINSQMLRSLNAMNDAISGTVTEIGKAGSIGELGTRASTSLGGLDSLFFGGSKVTDRGINVLSGSISDAINGDIFEAYEIARKRGFFGSSNSTNTGALEDGITNQISLIFESMNDAILAGAEALGVDSGAVQTALDAYQIEEQRISLMDLSPDEQRAELEAVFSSIFDGLVDVSIPFITQFQQAGEGLGETLARVSTTVLIFEEAIESMGLDFIAKQVDPELFAQAAVAISDFAGGMESFIDGYTTYVSKFLSEAEQMDILTGRLSGIFSELDLALPGTREGFTSLIQGLDLTTASGQEAFGTLISLSGQMDSYYDGLEDNQQRAADAMDRFFANFYSDEELNQRSLGQSSDLLGRQAENLGLDADMSMAEFRTLFNEQMPNLTADQIALWLEFAETLVRVNDLEEQRNATLQAEIQALQEYNDFARSINDQIAELTGNGGSDFQNRIAEIGTGLQTNIDGLNEMAIAAGLAGASEADLANAHRLAALQTEQAIGILREATQSLIDELYGDQAQSQVNDFSNSFQSGISNVSQAGSNLFSQWESALQRIDDYTNSLLTNSALSPLSKPDQLAQAKGDFYDLITAANSGDVEAAQAVPAAMQDFLTLLKDVERSGGDYNSEFFAAIAAAQGIETPGGLTEQQVTVSPSQSYRDFNTGLAEQNAEATALNRLELSQALAEHVADLAAAINKPVLELFTAMGGDIEQFLVDLGIDTSAATGETTAMLANLAQTLNIQVTDLATSVDLSLGSLVDAQSLLNDGLEWTIDKLPDGIQNTLEPLLRDVENAADGAAQETALASLETATASLPAEYRNMLAPYFENIDSTTELAQTVLELQDQTTYLALILDTLRDANRKPPTYPPAEPPQNPPGPPEYALGTAFVPDDQTAVIHKGEMIIPAREAGILRGMGVNLASQGGGDNKAVIEELRQVKAELQSMRSMQRGKFDEQSQLQGRIVQNTIPQPKQTIINSRSDRKGVAYG